MRPFGGSQALIKRAPASKKKNPPGSIFLGPPVYTQTEPGLTAIFKNLSGLLDQGIFAPKFVRFGGSGSIWASPAESYL